jgi:DNA-binding NarL/FixJ family response regulator
MKTTIVLIEGRKLAREGLSHLLQRHADLDVVGEADHLEAAPKLIRAMTPHVAIYIVGLAASKFVEAVWHLAAGKANTKSIVLLAHHDPHVIRRFIEAGASGCLTQDCSSDEIAAAIRTVQKGKPHLSVDVAGLFVTHYVKQQSRGVALSARERAALQLIANGQTTKEIAQELKVSAKTIETYRRRIMQKLKLRSVAELTKYAVLEGLSTLEQTRG